MGILQPECSGQPRERIQREDIAYGCLFCITGKEELIAKRISEKCKDVRAITMRKMKYRTNNGQKSKEEALLLPSYVFFMAPSDIEPFRAFPKTDVIRILCTGDGMWQLQGEDRRFTRWLFQYNGLLDFSQAYREGDRIHIVSGPLKDMEGKITKVDRRGCSGQVAILFNGRVLPVWLGFELIERHA